MSTRKTEAEIQTDVINALIKEQVGVIRINGLKATTPNGGMVKGYICYAGKIDTGISDLIAFRDGRAWFLEVKRPGREPDADQVRFMAWAEWYNMRYAVVTSPDDALTVVFGGQP